MRSMPPLSDEPCQSMSRRAALHATEITPDRLSPEETQRFRTAAQYSRSAHGLKLDEKVSDTLTE